MSERLLVGIQVLAALWQRTLAFAHRGISEWETSRTDLLAVPHASAKGIEGNKDLLVIYIYILVVTGCCIRPWKESVGWLN